MKKKIFISLLVVAMGVMALGGCEKNNSCEFCKEYSYYKPGGRFLELAPEIFQYDSLSQTLSIDQEENRKNRELELALVPPNRIPQELMYSQSKTGYFIVCAKLKIVGQKGKPDAYGNYKKRDKIKCYYNIRPVNYISSNGHLYNNDSVYYKGGFKYE